MKAAQIVKFRIKDGCWQNIVSLVADWQKNHASEQDGIVDTFIWRETRNPLEGTALVVCKDTSALESFSANPTTLNFFEAAKSFLDGEPDYLHGDLISADMLPSFVKH